METTAATEQHGPIIAFDLGGTTVSVGVISPPGERHGQLLGDLVELRLRDPGCYATIAADISEARRRCLAQADVRPEALGGAAAAMPGPADYDSGTSWAEHKLAGLHGRSLAPLIGLARRPLAFVDDAVAVALAEHAAGAGRGCERCLVLTLGTGLGAAFLDNGRALTSGPGVPPGARLWAQPFGGSATVTVEDEVGAPALAARYQRLTGEDLDLAEIARRAHEGEEVARQIFTHLGQALAIGAAPSVRDFAPDRVILAGGVARAHRLFASDLEAALADLVGGRPTPVVPGELGGAAALIGAAQALEARRQRFARRQVIFLHGFASSPGAYKAGRFAEALGHRGVTLDVPAMDEGDFREATLSGGVALLERLTAGRPPGSVLLIGSSFGAYTAALFAARSERVAAMVLMAPAFDFASRWAERLGPEQVARWATEGQMMTMNFASGEEEPISWGLMTDARRHPPFPDVRVPTLVLHGERDEVVPPELSRRFAAGRPNVELVLVDADHGLAQAIDEILTRSMDFLDHWWC